MRPLDEVRRNINAIDEQLVELIRRRLELADEVAKAKLSEGKTLVDQKRELEILREMTERLPEAEREIRKVFEALFEMSKNRQAKFLAELSGKRTKKIAVVGLGLIGGSFYKATVRAGYETVGLHHGDVGKVGDADILMVCLPPDAVVPWIDSHKSEFKPGATVVDICGVKASIMRDIASVEKSGWTFVGGHPMAGKEVAGWENSTPDLFTGASMILTPPKDCEQTVIDDLRRYFASVGFGRTVITTPEFHDEMIAFTSQLCHVIATCYARDPHVESSAGFSAGSYADMTRIATQNPEIWSELFLSNAESLSRIIDAFIGRFLEFRKALGAGDSRAIKEIIVEGTKAKLKELEQYREG